MTADQIAEAARLLVRARHGPRLNSLPSDATPMGLEEAYQIQFAGAQLSGEPIIAYKVGLTSDQAQRAAGIDAPIFGQLGPSQVARSPARLPVGASHLRIVEAEVVFQLNCDLSADKAPFTTAQIATCIGGTFAGIEVCNSAFENGDAPSTAQLVADNCNADTVVIGEALPCDLTDSFPSMVVTLSLQSGQTVQGSTAQVLGDPLKSVTWLANALAARGVVLREGQWVSSGTCSGFIEAARSDTVVATFGSKAMAAVEFAPAPTR
jgi:2-keto-4-pentenoate hydratase